METFFKYNFYMDNSIPLSFFSWLKPLLTVMHVYLFQDEILQKALSIKPEDVNVVSCLPLLC